MTVTDSLSPALHEPAAGTRVRGSIAVLGGAAETVRVYERFGRRLATDGYVVGVFEATAADQALEWLAAREQSPRALIGSDRGAAIALGAAANGAPVDGVVVAGTPVSGRDDAAADSSQRTACPVHLGVLGSAEAVSKARAESVAVPDAAALAGIQVPVLAVHGGADQLAPFADARAALSTIDDLELVETVDGLHDALNDHSHRSVAATVVLWLERLRADGVAVPIVRSVAP